jgi:DNA invertase Pin-like site-specific DNA recombinase
MNELSNLLLNTNIMSDTIIYVRSSTKNQNNPLINSASQATQTTLCIQYCKDQQISNVNTNNIYYETCSARGSAKQKVLLNLISTCTKKIFICYDVSRFSRSYRDGTDLIHKCIDNELEVHFVRDNIVVKNNKEMFRFSMALISAQNESDVLSARIKDSISFRKTNGTYNIIREKFGFDLSKDNNNKNILIINEREQKVIEQILKLFYGCLTSEIKLANNIVNNDKIIMYGNYGYTSIASFLNNSGMLNKCKVWSANTIRNVIDKHCEYILDRDNLSEDLIIEMINMRSTIDVQKYVVLVKDIYFKINSYSLIESDKKIGKIQNDYDMLKFLNRNVVNFRTWDEHDLKKITDYHINNINGKRIRYVEPRINNCRPRYI